MAYNTTTLQLMIEKACADHGLPVFTDRVQTNLPGHLPRVNGGILLSSITQQTVSETLARMIRNDPTTYLPYTSGRSKAETPLEKLKRANKAIDYGN